MKRFPACILAVLMVVARPVYAADGDLDVTFGIRGRVATNFVAPAFAIQSNGKIVVAGSTSHPSISWYSGSDFVIARFNSDGSPDAAFGMGGKVTTDFSGMRDEARALVIQSDGKIVVAGLAGQADMIVTPVPGLAIRGPQWVFGLARYNSDGSLDANFGDKGKVTTVFSGNREEATALAIQSDGKIVAAGITSRVDGAGPGQLPKFALARYNRDGSLDPTFGIGGKIATAVGYHAWLSALAIGPDSKILAGGSAAVNPSQPFDELAECLGDWTTSNMDFALVRYNPDGALDTSFGDGGVVTTDFSELLDYVAAIRIQSDGNIVVAGYAGDAKQIVRCNPDSYYKDSFALARYNSIGSMDISFGSGGTVTRDLGTADAFAIQSDGKIVVAGSDDNKSGLFRYNRDGSPDPSFGVEGKVPTDFGGIGVAIQSDGKIVAGGKKYDNGTLLYVLARFDNDSPPSFHPAVVHPGHPFTFKFPAAVRDTAYLDIRFRGPGSATDQIALNWQRGMSAEHIVPSEMAAGEWILTGVRTHEDPNNHSGDFVDVSLPLVVKVLPLLVTEMRFEPAGVHLGSAFTATFSGASLTNETYFDIRFRSPGSDRDQVALNWQRGAVAGHLAAIGLTTGQWTVTGIRAHQDPNDHSADFTSVESTLMVAP